MARWNLEELLPPKKRLERRFVNSLKEARDTLDRIIKDFEEGKKDLAEMDTLDRQLEQASRLAKDLNE